MKRVRIESRGERDFYMLKAAVAHACTMPEAEDAKLGVQAGVLR